VANDDNGVVDPKEPTAAGRPDLVTEALRSSEERLRALFESAGVGLVLCGAGGEILFVNRRASVLLDRHGDDTELDDWLSTVHPADRPEVDAAIRSACELDTVVGVRHRVVHHDGSEVWVDHKVAPFREGGSVNGFVSTLVDVTAERNAMAELAASHDFTEAVLDMAGVLVVVADSSGRIVRFNKTCEAVSGFSASAVLGLPLVETLLPVDQRDQASSIMDELARSSSANLGGGLENEWLTSDGSRRRISWTYTTVEMPDGSIAIIGTGTDITQRRLLESRVAQSDRLDSIGRLTAGVAHDFNNTLTTLRLRIDRLSGRELDDASRGDLAAAAATIDRTQHLIADLLAFSTRGSSAPVDVVISMEIRRVVDLLADLFGASIRIELDLMPDEATVTIDPARLEQALTNLALNARDAMPDGGTLTISTCIETIVPLAAPDPHVPSKLAAGDYLVLSVADTGTGIEPSDAPHVFDPYYTTKSPGRGTGLGLATTYGTVVQSGGAIIVDSTPGEGTTFRIWLPLATDDTGRSVDPEQPVPVPVPGSRSRMLVVDDDDEIRAALVAELSRLGHRATQAESATTALALLEEPVDVLVCDVQLPDLGGSEVAARFRRRHPEIRVVFMSGATSSELREVLPSDAVVLAKPFPFGDLLAAVNGNPERR
jgi:PAS domain S-box-containing protein